MPKGSLKVLSIVADIATIIAMGGTAGVVLYDRTIDRTFLSRSVENYFVSPILQSTTFEKTVHIAVENVLKSGDVTQIFLAELDKISLKSEHNTWITGLEENVTENGVRRYISQQMDCGEDRLEVSEFIRFGRGNYELKDEEKCKVPKFVGDLQDPNITTKKWTVFGFASPDGDQGGNDSLSQKRAQAVKKALCEQLGCSGTSGTEIAIKGLSEDHSTNGVANSRSARIGVCVNQKAGEDEERAAQPASTKPRETAAGETRQTAD